MTSSNDNNEDEKHPTPRGILRMEEVLRRQLAVAGIIPGKPASMRLWLGGPAESFEIVVETFGRFLRTPVTNIPVIYQIDVEETEIRSIGKAAFKVPYMSVLVEYDPKKGCGRPRVQSGGEEEITSEWSDPDSVQERAQEIGEKIKAILHALLLFRQASESVPRS